MMTRFMKPGIGLDELIARFVLRWQYQKGPDGLSTGWVNHQDCVVPAIPKFSTHLGCHELMIDLFRELGFSLKDYFDGLIWVKNKGRELLIWDTAEDYELKEFKPIYPDSVYWVTWVGSLGALKAFADEEYLYDNTK